MKYILAWHMSGNVNNIFLKKRGTVPMKISRLVFMMICCVLAQRAGQLNAEPSFQNEPAIDINAEIKAIIDDIASPLIGFDPIGNAIAVWYDIGGVRYAIYAARYDVNSGWKAKIILSDNIDIIAPQIEFDSSGNAFVFWTEDNGFGNSNIYVARYVTGTGWKPKVNLSSTNMRASNPSIAIDNAGNAIMVWREIAVGGYTDYAARFTPASGWQGKIKIS